MQAATFYVDVPRTDLKPEIAERVRARLRVFRDRAGSNAAAARLLHISAASVGQLLAATPKNSPSLQTAERLAEALKVEVTELLYGGTATGGQTVDLDDRYPNRAAAVPIARQGGVDEAAIGRVLELELDADEDPPTLWWLDRMRSEETMAKGRSTALGPRLVRGSTPRPRGAE